VATLTRSHAAFETGSQIGITDSVEGGDDLPLLGAEESYFVLRGDACVDACRLQSGMTAAGRQDVPAMGCQMFR